MYKYIICVYIYVHICYLICICIYMYIYAICVYIYVHICYLSIHIHVYAYANQRRVGRVAPVALAGAQLHHPRTRIIHELAAARASRSCSASSPCRRTTTKAAHHPRTRIIHELAAARASRSCFPVGVLLQKHRIPHHPRTRPAENAAVKVVLPFILAHATALLQLFFLNFFLKFFHFFIVKGKTQQRQTRNLTWA